MDKAKGAQGSGSNQQAVRSHGLPHRRSPHSDLDISKTQPSRWQPAHEPGDLCRRGFRLYEKFRAQVPRGNQAGVRWANWIWSNPGLGGQRGDFLG